MLEALVSPSNEERRRAEAAFQSYLLAEPVAAIEKLTMTLQDDTACEVQRLLAAVLLRQSIIAKPIVWSSLSMDKQCMTMNVIIQVLRTTLIPGLRRRCADAVAAAVQAYLGTSNEEFSISAVWWTLENVTTVAGLELLERICSEASPVALASGIDIADTLMRLMEDAHIQFSIKAGAARCALAWSIEAETQSHFEMGSRLLATTLACLQVESVEHIAKIQGSAEFILRALSDIIGDECDDEDLLTTSCFLARRVIVEPHAREVVQFAMACASSTLAGSCRWAALEVLDACISAFGVELGRPEMAQQLALCAFGALIDGALETPIEIEDWCTCGRHISGTTDALGDEELLFDHSYAGSAPFTGMAMHALCILERIASAAETETDMHCLHATLAPCLVPLLTPGAGEAEARRAALAAVAVVCCASVPGSVLAAVAKMATSDGSLAVRAAAFDCLNAICEVGDDADEDMEEDLSFFEGLELHENDAKCVLGHSSIRSDQCVRRTDSQHALRAKIITSAALQTLSENLHTVETLFTARSACHALVNFCRFQVASDFTSAVNVLARVLAASSDALGSFLPPDLMIAHCALAAECTSALAEYGRCAQRKGENEAKDFAILMITNLLNSCLTFLCDATLRNSKESVLARADASAAIALAFTVSTCLDALEPLTSSDVRVRNAVDICIQFTTNVLRERLRGDLLSPACVIERGCLRNLARMTLAMQNGGTARGFAVLACATVERGPFSIRDHVVFDNTCAACKALYEYLRTTRGVVSALSDFDHVAMRVAATLGDVSRYSTSTEAVVFAASTIQRLLDDKIAAASISLSPDAFHHLVCAVTPVLIDALRQGQHRQAAHNGEILFTKLDADAAIAEVISRCLHATHAGLAKPIFASHVSVISTIVDCAVKLTNTQEMLRRQLDDLLEHLGNSLISAVRCAQSESIAAIFSQKVASLLSSWVGKGDGTSSPFDSFIVATCEAFFDCIPKTHRMLVAQFVTRCVSSDVQPVRHTALRAVITIANSEPRIQSCVLDTLSNVALEDATLQRCAGHVEHDEKVRAEDERCMALASLVRIISHLPFGWVVGDDTSLASKLLRRLPIREKTDWARDANETWLLAFEKSISQPASSICRVRARQIARILRDLASEQAAPLWALSILQGRPMSRGQGLVVYSHFHSEAAAIKAASAAYWLVQLLPGGEKSRQLATSLEHDLSLAVGALA